MPDILNKGRILRLLQYLYLNTDEEHAATTQDLIDALAETGFKANRKTVKDDIDVMNNMGYDIVINVSSGNSFFLGDRTFELPELKLLIDAVSSSRFISAEKSQQLIDKITTLASVNQRNQLIQRIYTKDRIKPTGSKIYYVVDQLSAWKYFRTFLIASVCLLLFLIISSILVFSYKIDFIVFGIIIVCTGLATIPIKFE